MELKYALVEERIRVLKALKKSIIAHENAVYKALHQDFAKPEFESYITEFQYTINELNLTIKKLKSWSKPKWIVPSIVNFPSLESIHFEPYGNVLIISPWNYPFQLAMVPLIGAVAAGNKVVLKPSEMATQTGILIEKIATDVFKNQEVKIVLGDADVSKNLLSQRWDYIFFTGSTNVGKIVAKAAAAHLTPCTLELGGKNPCIIDETANIEITAKRIVWGKFLNAGQTCVAPDFLMVQAKEKFNLVEAIKKEIVLFYGKNPQESPDFARIINHKHWDRLHRLMTQNEIVFGGESNRETKYIAPTLLEINNPDHEIMQDEIFGPLLPILTYSEPEDLLPFLRKFEKPLAFYIFSENKVFVNQLIQQISAGGVCVNDTIVQLINHRLPFGGVGMSGMGAYHGKHTFITFSHQKTVVKRATWMDLPIKYAPYSKKIRWIKMLMKRM